MIENASEEGARPFFTIEMDNQIENKLDQGVVPGTLENVFESGGGSLPENTTIVPVDNRWELHIANIVYTLREENGMLGLYMEAPDFTVTTFDGGTFTVSGHLGEVVLLDIMGVGCPPCVVQMPELREVKLEMGENITILSVDIRYSGEDEERVREVYGQYILE